MIDRLKLKTRVLTAIVILANVLGNFLMSWGLRLRRVVLGSSATEYLETLFNPYVALGVSLLVLWMLSRMTLLSWADLSYVLPVTSVGYVLSAAMGAFFLAEHVSLARWAGTLLIVAGTALVGSTAIRTTSEAQK